MTRPALLLARRLLVGLCLLLPLVAGAGFDLVKPAAREGDKRIALVIGNARYPAIPLRNPENDAKLIAANLRKLGFEVNEQLNLGVLEFRRTLRDFARRLQEEDAIAVFYYAGHGVQIDGRNYLLPVDINLRDQEEVKDESVDIEEAFLSRLDKVRSKARIVILDACRDNPFGTTRMRNIRAGGGLAEMAARGTLIAYASAPGAPAEDGPSGKNSVYTSNLAREMMAPGLEVEQMFKNVRVGVLRDTKDRQVPWVNTSLTSNFSFNPSQGPSPEAQAQDARVRQLEAERDEALRQLKAMGAAGAAAAAEKLATPAPPATAPKAQAAGTDDANKARVKRVEAERDQAVKALEASRAADAKAAAAAAKGKSKEPPKDTATAKPPDKPRPEARREANREGPRPADDDRPKVRVATVKPETAVAAVPDKRPASPGRQDRCRDLLSRTSIGDALSAAESSFLKQECK